jgi:hypothetical protein
MRSAVFRLGAASVVVLIVCTYGALVVLYANTVVGTAANNLSDNPGMVDQTTATFTVEQMEPNNTGVIANLAVSPGSGLLDPDTHRLKEDLVLVVRSAVAPVRRDYAKGMLPGVFPVALTLAGHVERWPFDVYHSGPVEVQLIRGTEGRRPPELVPSTFIDHLPGLIVSATKVGENESYRLNVQRSLSTALFAVVVVVVLITIVVLGAVVAVQTLRNRRQFQPPMTTWYAAMLFAVVPLRNALPGAPPFGAWVDVTVVLWVILALGVAMLIYINCWWRHLSPVADTPT